MKKSKLRFEKIKDDYGVAGYKLGNYYLMKMYCWGNQYNWIINKDGRCSYFECDWRRAVDNDEVILVKSCKEGKEKLIELYQEEINKSKYN